MLEQLLNHLHNWFQVGVYPGEYVIEGGVLETDFLQEGQYFRIVGSVFNDGLHRYGPEMEALADETFTGAIWALAVPRAVEELSGEIAAWQKKNQAVLDSPYTSESFGGYSYTRDSAAGESGWQGVFRARLNPYRKL